jgi:aminotransferase
MSVHTSRVAQSTTEQYTTKPQVRNVQTSHKVQQFTESVIREMTRQAIEHGAVNLAQGFPDFAAPEEIKRAAQKAIEEDLNQYAITWGAKNFRSAIAQNFREWQKIDIDPEREVTVCCGSTEAMIATLLALLNPGDEIIIFEPFYENYGPDAILSGAVRRYVTLRPPNENAADWYFDPAELRNAFTPQTRAIIINTPHNPTGKVFSRPELELIRDLCIEHDTIAITDEIYEHILYDGAEHISLATLEGMRDRTITINSLSKTYSVTGWRVGWAIASPDLTSAIRKVHDFLTVGAASPLQAAGITALSLPRAYYDDLAEKYTERRDLLLNALLEVGFNAYIPQGAYYIMTDISSLNAGDDRAFAHRLVREIGVGAVPGSGFYRHPELGAHQIRFTFCKKIETLHSAIENLQKLRTTV